MSVPCRQPNDTMTHEVFHASFAEYYFVLALGIKAQSGLISGTGRNPMGILMMGRTQLQSLSSILKAAFCLMWLCLLGCGECEQDYDCPGRLVCNKSLSQCERFVCKKDQDCGVGHICNENRCEQTTETGPNESVDDLELQGR